MAEQREIDELVALNARIGEAEDTADAGFFEALLHERFTMQRPSGAIDDRRALVDGLALGAHRRTGAVSAELVGATRAVVRCTVTKWEGPPPGACDEPPADAARFDNLRVFLRSGPGSPWQLLAWLNEPAT